MVLCRFTPLFACFMTKQDDDRCHLNAATMISSATCLVLLGILKSVLVEVLRLKQGPCTDYLCTCNVVTVVVLSSLQPLLLDDLDSILCTID